MYLVSQYPSETGGFYGFGAFPCSWCQKRIILRSRSFQILRTLRSISGTSARPTLLRVPVDPEATFSPSDVHLADGVLVIQTSETSLDVHKLSSKGSDKRSRWSLDLDVEFSSLVLEPSQDLLVLIQRPSRCVGHTIITAQALISISYAGRTRGPRCDQGSSAGVYTFVH